MSQIFLIIHSICVIRSAKMASNLGGRSFSLNFPIHKARPPRKLKYILIILPIFSFTIFYYFGLDRYRNGKSKFTKGIGIAQSGDFILPENYLRSIISSTYQTGYLVNNDKCQIPDWNIWNDGVTPFLEESGQTDMVSCGDKSRNGTINGLTFVRKQAIVINVTLLESLNLSMDELKCCYQTVEPAQQNLDVSGRKANKEFRLSDNCIQITAEETTPISGFVKVTCKKKLVWFLETQLHTDFHILATFENSSKLVREKIKFWKDLPTNYSQPPNVIILGIGSTSRMNFRRWMTSTTELLNEMGAIEMLGYTKVGDNISSNFMAILTDLLPDELGPSCDTTQWAEQVLCPNIWKNFSAANYLTVHLEDVAGKDIFQNSNTAFSNPLVDIFPRPWMQAAFKTKSCIGSLRPDQVILNYLVDLVQLTENHKLPYFITSWMTDLTNENISSLHNLDGAIYETILTLRDGGHLQNTILVFISDQGYQHFKIRRSGRGWLEEKLPAMWVALPETINEIQPTWVESLQHNSHQLTSPFDVYEMLKDILEFSQDSYVVTSVSDSGQRGQSLFKKISARSCEEAGIPLEYCACGSLTDVAAYNSSYLDTVAKQVVAHINDEFQSDKCSRLQVDRITAAAFKSDLSRKLLIIGFAATPDDIQVEAVLAQNSTEGVKAWEVVNVLRTNTINKCKLNDGDDQFCQCTSNH